MFKPTLKYSRWFLNSFMRVYPANMAAYFMPKLDFLKMKRENSV